MFKRSILNFVYNNIFNHLHVKTYKRYSHQRHYKKKTNSNFFWENVLNLIFIIKVQKSFKKKK